MEGAAYNKFSHDALQTLVFLYPLSGLYSVLLCAKALINP